MTPRSPVAAPGGAGSSLVLVGAGLELRPGGRSCAVVPQPLPDVCACAFDLCSCFTDAWVLGRYTRGLGLLNGPASRC